MREKIKQNLKNVEEFEGQEQSSERTHYINPNRQEHLERRATQELVNTLKNMMEEMKKREKEDK